MKMQSKHLALCLKSQGSTRKEDTQKAHAAEERRFPSEIKPSGDPNAVKAAQVHNKSVVDGQPKVQQR